MHLHIHPDEAKLGQTAGKEAAALLRTIISSRDSANLVIATGTSQFGVLETLVAAPGIQWEKVNLFHLDEYVGLSAVHKASFRRYIQERFISKVGKLAQTFLINGDTILSDECRRLNQVISDHPTDLALVGIGENGHLAFNDPPANFETETPYILVDLDDACRRQQLGEGWFKSLHEVPLKAISMSVQQIMKSRHIICAVPGERKAKAVHNTLVNEISNRCPASILRNHAACHIHLDAGSASLLPDHIKATAE